MKKTTNEMPAFTAGDVVKTPLGNGEVVGCDGDLYQVSIAGSSRLKTYRGDKLVKVNDSRKIRTFSGWLKEDMQDCRLYVDVPAAKAEAFRQIYPNSGYDEGTKCHYIDMSGMSFGLDGAQPISQELLTDLTQQGFQAICCTDDGKIRKSYNSSKTKRFFPQYAPQDFM